MVRRVSGAGGSLLWRALFVAALAFEPDAFAQDVVLQASVDRPIVRDNESFTYTIRAEGSLRAEPELAPLEQTFDVLGRMKNSRMQFVNGQTAQVTEWEYQLMPKSSGALTLPALRVGNSFTNPVELQVVAADTSGAAPADIFMELEATPSTVYVQSQVIFTLRLFVGAVTGRATLTTPQISGGEAIIERLGEDSAYRTARGGRDFEVRERRYAIFPQQVGTLTVGPATFEAMVIPDRGFSRVRRFQSGSLALTVQPAVPPPSSSPSAVWLPARRVALSEVWSDASGALTVGVPQTRTVIIDADGLLETQLPELIIDQQPGIRQYADQPVLEREVTPEGLRSRRAVSLAVIAQSPGEITLAGVELPWWNVTEQRWEVARLEPRTLQVLPSAESAPANQVTESATEEQPSAARSGNIWPMVSAVLGGGWALTILLWWALWLRGRRRAGAAGRKPEHPDEGSRHQPNARHVLRALSAACGANDAAGARSALLQWAERRFPAAPPRSLGALAPLLPEAIARQVLDLEAHLYGAAAGPWDGHGLSAMLRDLDATGQPAGQPKDETLLPLYR